MTKQPAIITIKGYCYYCKENLRAEGTEKELLEGKTVTCQTGGHTYVIGWNHPKKNSRGDHGGIFQYGPANEFVGERPPVVRVEPAGQEEAILP